MDRSANGRFSNKTLFFILGSGFLLKLLYLFVIGPRLFGAGLCTSNDTFSYTTSFINLVNTGSYTHNPDYEPAYYGRLPAVGFFWGLFYLVFGLANSYKAFAVFQIVLDVLAAVYVYRITEKFFPKKAALTATLVYVFFPLTIYFVVKTGVEYLTVFFTVAVFYHLVFYRPALRHSVKLGVLLILGLFVKETLLLLLPLAFIYLYRNYNLSVKYYLIIFIAALCTYAPWPVRNYIRSGSLMLTKPITAGYLGFKEDMTGYVYWMYAWHDVDMLGYFNASYNDSIKMVFPKEIFNSPTEEEMAYNLIALSRRCGSSFTYWKKVKGLPVPQYHCNQDKLIGRGFDLLRKSYISTHGFVFYVKVPLQNLARAFFKNSLTTPDDNIDALFKIVMVFRSLLLLAGIGICIAFRRHDFFVLSLIFFLIYYFFICAVYRHLEMRYLLPADVPLIIIAAAGLTGFFLKEKAGADQAN